MHRSRTPVALAAAVALGSSLGTPARAQRSAAGAPDLPTLTAHEVRALEVCGGGPLTPAERAQAAGLVAAAMRADPTGWVRADAKMYGSIAAAERKRDAAAQLNHVRAGCRLWAEFGAPNSAALAPANAVERAIVRSHDPTVAADPKTKALITAQTVTHLRAGAARLAQLTGYPAPSADFVPLVTRRLAAGAVAPGSPLFHAFADGDESAPFVDAGLGVIPAAKRAQSVARDRAEYARLAPDEQQWRLASDAASIGSGGIKAVSLNNAMAVGLYGRLLEQNFRNTWNIGP